jgi:histone deacetylase 1/2
MHAKVPIGEPTTVDEALGHKHWVMAMDAEYQALMKNKTWRLVPRPKGKKCCWV